MDAPKLPVVQPLAGISSMATRLLLAELADAWRAQSGGAVHFESVGGVKAAQRIREGEVFDIAVLDADVIDRLVADGYVVAGSQTAVVRSGVAIAVKAGARRPDASSEVRLRDAVRAAASIGYSTGPSGTALLRLFERWGIMASVAGRLVQAPPGVPVGRLVAEGTAEIGFQQISELIHVPGIELIRPMPPGCEITTVFSAGLCSTSRQPDAVRALLAFMASPVAEPAKQRQGMESP